MKKVRTIRIKDPKLQKIRNNLRIVILKACSKKKSEISNQEHDLKHDKNGKYIGVPEGTSKILKKLNDEWWEIERPLRASIIKCPGCNKHKKDMTYYPYTRTWYCVDCYEAQHS